MGKIAIKQVLNLETELDSKISISNVTNGLNVTNSTLGLGGTLIENTVLSLTSHNLIINDSTNNLLNLNGDGSFSLGSNSVNTNSTNVVIGNSSGNNSGTIGSNAITIGSNSNNGSSGIGSNSITIGNALSANNTGSIIFGNNSTNSATNSIAFGWNSTTPQILLTSSISDKSYINSNGGLIIGDHGSNANTDAILELESTDKALLVTRLSDPNNNVPIAVNGMIAYDSTDNELQAYVGNTWVTIGSTSGDTATTISGLTQNYLTKSNLTGDNILDSRLEDNGISLGIGSNYNLNRSGEIILANGSFSNNGDSQTSEMIARRQTTDATLTEIFLDGISQRVSIINNSIAFFTVDVVGLQTGGLSGTSGAAIAHKYEGVIKNISNTTTLISTPTQMIIDEDISTNWAVTVDADDTNDTLRIRVQGEANKNINWVARIKLIETRF